MRKHPSQQGQSPLPDPVRDPQFYDVIPTKRFTAWLIDSVVILIISGVLTLAIGLITNAFGFAQLISTMLTTGFIYHWISLTRMSATPGMCFVGVEFCGHDGLQLGHGQAAFHSLVFMMALVSVLGAMLHGALILKTAHHQGLPDLMLGSVVINRPLQ
ncbi:RDD family protein [Halovulum sp. GXIMD14793]